MIGLVGHALVAVQIRIDTSLLHVEPPFGALAVAYLLWTSRRFHAAETWWSQGGSGVELQFQLVPVGTWGSVCFHQLEDLILRATARAIRPRELLR